MKSVCLSILCFSSTILSSLADQLNITSPSDDLVLEQSLGEQQIVPVEFDNPTPTSPLSWEIIFQNESTDSLERVLEELKNSPGPLLSLLPGRFDFEGGVSGSQIDLGGGSSGRHNQIRLDHLRINYSNFSTTTVTVGDGTARYATAKLPGLFVFSGELEGINEFRLLGGRDPVSGVEVTVDDFTVELAGTTWRAFIKRTKDFSTPSYRSRKPSINQMILLPDSPGVTSSFDPANDGNRPSVTNLPASTPLHYFYFLRPEGATYDLSVFEKLAKTFLGRVHPGPLWCQAVPSRGTVSAGDTARLDLQIKATPGTEETRFAIVTPGTDPETLPSSAWRSLTLEVSSPAFRLPPEPLQLTALAGGDPLAIEFEILPAPGASTVPALTVTSSANWLSSTPLANQRWELTGQTSELAPGAYSEQLTFSDGISTVSVPIQVEVTSRNPIALLADSIRPRLYALSKVGPKLGFLIVHDTVTQSETKTIILNQGPTDFAINETASEMFVLNTHAPSISRIDLDTLTLVETIPLNEYSQIPGNYDSRIVAGPGSIELPFVNDAWQWQK